MKSFYTKNESENSIAHIRRNINKIKDSYKPKSMIINLLLKYLDHRIS